MLTTAARTRAGGPSARWINEASYCAAIAFLLAVCLLSGMRVLTHLRWGLGLNGFLNTSLPLAGFREADPATRLTILIAMVLVATGVSMANSGVSLRVTQVPGPGLGMHRLLVVALGSAVALTPLAWSFGSALTNPANGSPPAAAAEWVRSHHGAGLVRWAETQWYSRHPPKVGGLPPPGAIPPAPAATQPPAMLPLDHLPAPQALLPLASPSLPGEGQWHPAGRPVKGIAAVYEAFMRPDPVHTSVVAGIAWMDPTLLSAQLNSGGFIPGSGPWQHSAPVPPEHAATLVAAFNGGFRMEDANGGYFSEGRTVVPLTNGAASVVISADGKATVAKWGRDAVMGADIVAVRQNLELLVDYGTAVPGLEANDTRRWGVTLGNHVYVWRSGLGVTADGALVYVGGPALNITTLADLLVRAGAVRGMELDINTDWVNLSTYNSNPASPAEAATLLPSMSGGPGRYFTPSWSRDFLTMSARPPRATRPAHF